MEYLSKKAIASSPACMSMRPTTLHTYRSADDLVAITAINAANPSHAAHDKTSICYM